MDSIEIEVNIDQLPPDVQRDYWRGRKQRIREDIRGAGSRVYGLKTTLGELRTHWHPVGSQQEREARALADAANDLAQLIPSYLEASDKLAALEKV